MVVTVLHIQVMMPCVSAQRQHDQECTMFILSLPVVIVAVPAGSLPSVFALDTLHHCHTFSVQKMQTKQTKWKIHGGGINCFHDFAKSVIPNLTQFHFYSLLLLPPPFNHQVTLPQIESPSDMKTFPELSQYVTIL